jgi:glucosylceramidase
MVLFNSILVVLIGVLVFHSYSPVPYANVSKGITGSVLSVHITQSARDTGDRLTTKDPIQMKPMDFLNKKTSEPITLEVDSKSRYQEILGFGGAFTEAAAYKFSQLTQANKNAIIRAYFGDKVDAEGANLIDGSSGDSIQLDSIKYAVGRVPIHSCDFSLESYTFDDNSGDFDMNYFNISRNYQWLIPMLKQSLDASDIEIRLFASPWSPPAWMKSNNQMLGSDLPCFKDGDEYLDAWALYLSKFITAHQEEGIDFWGMTVQNEPEFDAPWEACMYTPEQERDFIAKHLGPRMKQDHPHLQIMIYDHNKDDIVTWAETILSDKEAAQYVAGTAFHWYSGFQFENLDTTHEMFPDKFLLASEATNCPGVSLGDWSRGEVYGWDIIGDLNSWSAGWVDWNLLLDMEGGPNHLNNYCDAAFVVDVEDQIVFVQPIFYYLGHLSKFVPPGSVRLGTELSDTMNGSIAAASFLTPSKEVVVVVMNQNDTDAEIVLHDTSKELATTYQIPAHGITTFVYDY